MISTSTVIQSRDADQPDDETLMRLIVDGDQRAFQTLVERYNRKYFQVAYRVVLNRSDAEDVVQNAFLRLWQKAAMWNPSEASFRTWFHRIVVNLSIDLVRQRRAVTVDEFPDLMDERPRADTLLGQAQVSQVVWKMIADLPENQRAALNLCHFEGFSNKEAADILGVNVKALESLLVRARKGIAARLSKQGITKDSLT